MPHGAIDSPAAILLASQNSHQALGFPDDDSFRIPNNITHHAMLVSVVAEQLQLLPVLHQFENLFLIFGFPGRFDDAIKERMTGLRITIRRHDYASRVHQGFEMLVLLRFRGCYILAV
jgi:hypothetical protein